MDAGELLIGQIINFSGNPFLEGPHAAHHDASGGLVIQNGRISAVGSAEDLRRDFPRAKVTDFGNDLILPGFIDAHVHYPQTAIIASWGKRLIDWLNTYTFPEEMRFSDPEYSAEVARCFFDLSLSHGTTTVASFCTIHPESVNAFFAEAKRRNLCAVGGKTCMDRNAPDGLRDNVQSAYDDSKRLLERWHGDDRLIYAITPRFSPTSTREQLEALGALWSEYPECPMQTHLSEQTDEVAWVAELFPEARDYLDTYEAAGLLGAGGLYGHAIHLADRERQRLLEAGGALVHCPTSNTFIGSGLFDMDGLTREDQIVGLATDTGGGSSFSMLRTMAAAYEVAQLRGRPLHPSELIWLATAGSARALRLGDRIGDLKPGYDADLVVMDLASTPAIAQRAARAKDIWEALFPTIMMGDDRAIRDVRVLGQTALC
ncbi:guanine deaminase [Silicimonas sp. MF1-12-2]|uniref:guanine deaminase n=1 Tax=Silicimonas sp. MF1-12-2 TaxID=3384793 RepID=UPI0039B4145E